MRLIALLFTVNTDNTNSDTTIYKNTTNKRTFFFLTLSFFPSAEDVFLLVFFLSSFSFFFFLPSPVLAIIAAEGRASGAAGLEANAAELPDASSVAIIPRALVFADCCNAADGGCVSDKLPMVAAGFDAGAIATDGSAAAAEPVLVGSSTSIASPPPDVAPLLFTTLESFVVVAAAAGAAELSTLLPGDSGIATSAAELFCFGCCCWGGSGAEEGFFSVVPPMSFFSSSLEELPSPARLDMTFGAALVFVVWSDGPAGASAEVGLLLSAAASIVRDCTIGR